MKHPHPPPAWVPSKDHSEWYWNHDGYMRNRLRPNLPSENVYADHLGELHICDPKTKSLTMVVTDLLVLLVEKGLIEMAEAEAVSHD